MHEPNSAEIHVHLAKNTQTNRQTHLVAIDMEMYSNKNTIHVENKQISAEVCHLTFSLIGQYAVLYASYVEAVDYYGLRAWFELVIILNVAPAPWNAGLHWLCKPGNVLANLP